MRKSISRCVFFTLFLLLITLPPASARAAEKFYVIDGDTFAWNGKTYRLWGIDAPEKSQSCRLGALEYLCGDKSRTYLQKLIDPTKLHCKAKPRAKKETRLVAQCSVAGKDLAQLMVLAGWAIDYRHFSGGLYATAEKVARDDQRGLWAGTFQNPRDWRKSHSQ